MSDDSRAIKVMPTTTQDGVGHEVCVVCGQPNPLTEDYVIAKHTHVNDRDFHPFSDWQVTVPATCLKYGFKERVCQVPGCSEHENVKYGAVVGGVVTGYGHKDPVTGEDLIKFDHIARVSCTQYVEVWKCTNPDCYTTVNKKGEQENTYPKESQYTVYRGIPDATTGGWTLGVNEWTLWSDVEKAASVSDAVTAANAVYNQAVKEAAVKQGQDYRTANNAFNAAFTPLDPDADDFAEKYDAILDQYESDLEAADNAYDFAVRRAAEVRDQTIENARSAILFCYTKVYTYATDGFVDHNTEHYDHHRYVANKWVETRSPACCVPGLMNRVCDDCGQYGEPYPIDALEPVYGTKVYTDYDVDWKDPDADYHWYHWVQCTRPECGDSYLEPIFGKIMWYVERDPATGRRVFNQSNPEFYTQANNYNLQAKVVDHAWGEWKQELKPTESSKGHWYRTCTIEGCGAREDFFGTEEEYEEMINPPTPPHPVLKSGLVWELEDGVPVCRYYEMGIFQEDFTGILDFDGGKFFVSKGIMCSDDSGLAEFGGVWYFLSAGQIQTEYTGLALYDGEWFYLSDGVLDLKKNGLVDYDGSKFLLGAGRIQSEVNGLYLEDDVWYFIGGGQVATSYTGLVEYDGEWFYVEKGILVPYNGEVEYDGGLFEVADGQVVAQIA
jgi:hypothetical protein